jgi:hypothetical protein
LKNGKQNTLLSGLKWQSMRRIRASIAVIVRIRQPLRQSGCNRAAIRTWQRALMQTERPNHLAIGQPLSRHQAATEPPASSFAHFLWIRLCASRSTVEKIVDLKEYFFREQE